MSASRTIRTGLWLAAGCLALLGQDAGPVREKKTPYFPTPLTVAERMLRLGGLRSGEKLYDLGSGDGRFVILAAEKFRADATGIEYDEDLCRASLANIHGRGLEKRAHIIFGDIAAQDVSAAQVVILYLLPDSIERFRPMLERQLRKGTRVVAHDFPVRAWTAAKQVLIEDDGEGRSHTLYLYVR
jgi:cyclopropane fatty-acyl-phospholipid synthase-like methyltransferase